MSSLDRLSVGYVFAPVPLVQHIRTERLVGFGFTAASMRMCVYTGTGVGLSDLIFNPLLLGSDHVRLYSYARSYVRVFKAIRLSLDALLAHKCRYLVFFECPPNYLL